jgi:hypothetical protein
MQDVRCGCLASFKISSVGYGIYRGTHAGLCLASRRCCPLLAFQRLIPSSTQTTLFSYTHLTTLFQHTLSRYCSQTRTASIIFTDTAAPFSKHPFPACKDGQESTNELGFGESLHGTIAGTYGLQLTLSLYLCFSAVYAAFLCSCKLALDRMGSPPGRSEISSRPGCSKLILFFLGQFSFIRILR